MAQTDKIHSAYPIISRDDKTTASKYTVSYEKQQMSLTLLLFFFKVQTDVRYVMTFEYFIDETKIHKERSSFNLDSSEDPWNDPTLKMPDNLVNVSITHKSKDFNLLPLDDYDLKIKITLSKNDEDLDTVNTYMAIHRVKE